MTMPVKLSASDPSVAGCSSWQHQVNAAQLMAQDGDLVAYLDKVPTGKDYFAWNGSLWKYVNNEDGSISDEPDVPAHNTGIFLCMGQLQAPGWSTKKKLVVGGIVAAVLIGGTTAAVVIHKRSKR